MSFPLLITPVFLISSLLFPSCSSGKPIETGVYYPCAILEGERPLTFESFRLTMEETTLEEIAENNARNWFQDPYAPWVYTGRRYEKVRRYLSFCLEIEKARTGEFAWLDCYRVLGNYGGSSAFPIKFFNDNEFDIEEIRFAPGRMTVEFCVTIDDVRHYTTFRISKEGQVR